MHPAGRAEWLPTMPTAVSVSLQAASACGQRCAWRPASWWAAPSSRCGLGNSSQIATSNMGAGLVCALPCKHAAMVLGAMLHATTAAEHVCPGIAVMRNTMLSALLCCVCSPASCAGHAYRVQPGDDPHHVAHPRRPALHGQRRLPVRAWLVGRRMFGTRFVGLGCVPSMDNETSSEQAKKLALAA